MCGVCCGGSVSKKRNPPFSKANCSSLSTKTKNVQRGAPLRKERMVVVLKPQRKNKNRVRLLMRKSSHEKKKKEFPPRGVKKKERQKKRIEINQSRGECTFFGRARFVYKVRTRDTRKQCLPHHVPSLPSDTRTAPPSSVCIALQSSLSAA